jgi:hypothetical protein
MDSGKATARAWDRSKSNGTANDEAISFDGEVGAPFKGLHAQLPFANTLYPSASRAN